jgi:hypothetical protein
LARKLRPSEVGQVSNVVVLVDDAVWPFRGKLWAHLVSDHSYDELHAFAARLGIPRRAFQGDHYDVPESVREQALLLGAQPVSSRTLVRRLRASGLRRPSARPDPHTRQARQTASSDEPPPDGVPQSASSTPMLNAASRSCLL